MQHLNIEKLKATPLEQMPYEHIIVPGFLSEETVQQVIGSYPDISKGGSFPLDTVKVSDILNDVITEMDGPDFEQAVAEKFSVDIKGRPKMYSLRGYCRKTDGKIHTDSKDKIITVLLYLNEKWTHDSGKLRLLKSGDNLEDYAAEVPPDNGTLLIFKRSDKSYHGHGSFEGVRRSIQMNWMVSEGKKGFHKLRHNISAGFKKMSVFR